jgi:hypothetical protein
MSDQELQILFEGSGAEALADRLMDFVETELEGEATGSVYAPDSADWAVVEAPAALAAAEDEAGDEEGLGDATDDIEASDDDASDDDEAPADDPLDDEPDDWEAVTSSDDGEASEAGFLVTVSRSCFEISDELDGDDVEARAEALLEWLDEETKHLPEVQVEIWIGADAAGAQALEELDAELLLELLEASAGR